jgi:RNA-directed DNA polymerase
MSAALSARSVRQAVGLDSVRALQRVLYRSAKQDRARRFHALFDKVARSDVLWQAWVDVARNGGAPGVDGVSIGMIVESGVRAFLDELAAALRAGLYRPQPLRRVFIPKPDGSQRPLGIPCVRDRVVMAAAKLVLEPVFEADFLPSSFGFRPKRSAHMALEAIREAANRGADWVLDADIKACFDQIDHDALMGLVARRVVDGKMLKLLRSWLRAGVLESGVLADTVAGTPQGSPISPLLANIALHRLDEVWQHEGGRRLGTLIRYADDFVVVCPTRPRAMEAQRRIEVILAELGLHVNPAKTRIVCLSGGAEGFDFLGFHLRKVEHWKYKRRWYLQRWPSARAMRTIRARVRDATQRRYVGYDLSVVVGRLNRILRGWGNYFRYGNSSQQFHHIDSYVHERLAILASAKHGRRGRNWARHYPWAWFTRLGVYRLSGTVRHGTAHAWR